MYNQRKEDKCHRIAAFGYETGAGSVEGRGLFAGVTVAGVHAEVTDLQDGFRWSNSRLGFQEKIFFGIGNNSNEIAKDGTTGSIVKWEFWMPTLGRFGHFTFGNGYDVSEAGDVAAQDRFLTEKFGEGFTADKVDKKGGRIF